MPTQPRPRSVVLAGGGTGGHIEPALALAECLRRHDEQLVITCLGTAKGLEREIIPARGWQLELVPAYPLPRKLGVDLLRTPGRIARSVTATRAILDRVHADAVVGFGGYVALPAYLAAWRRGTPIVVHEVNSPAGIANRIGARLTRYVGLGGNHVTLRHGRVVGVPLRSAISQLDRQKMQAKARVHFGLEPDRATLLVFGGSQGARAINHAVATAVPQLIAAGVQILHIIGARNSSSAPDLPPALRAAYVTVSFVEQMELAYAAADLALCRGGALSCAELAAVGLPAIYVPLPWGNGEQRRNARPVVQAGGGVLVEESELTPDWITQTVVGIVTNPARLTQMGAAAAGFGRRDGDEALRALLYEAVTA